MKAIIFLFCLALSPALIAFAASSSIESEIGNLKQKRYQMSSFDKKILDLNVQRAYEWEKGMLKNPISFLDDKKKFWTTYFIPTDSYLLNLTTNDLLEKLKGETNHLQMSLLRALGLPYDVDMGPYVKAIFITYENGNYYTVGIFDSGELKLVRELYK
jgi:hypothetical protein